MMRLRRLNLDLFGGFTGKRYDFGPRRTGGAPDFHVIYGPNEAGKTTTMEGYLRLLYGFAHREPYDFLHQRKNLTVSGVLEIDGAETEFTRLPTRAPSLRDANGQTLPDTALSACLGGLTEHDYRNLLCLDDLTIETGGEEITRAKGDIGRLLFSAAAGISDLSEVLDAARAEADALYRKRASSTRMAALKKALAEVETDIRARDVTAAQYRDMRKTAEIARAEEAEVSARRTDLFAQTARLDAHLTALPLLAEIDALEQKLEPFAAWPTQLDVDPEVLVQMLTDQATAQRDLTTLGAEIDALSAEMAAISFAPEHAKDPDALLQSLADLDDLRIRYKSAGFDLERRRAALEQIRADMRRTASDLRAPDGIAPEDLVLPSVVLSELDSALARLREAAQALAREREELVDLDDRLAAAEDQRDALSKVGTPNELVEVFARFDVDRLTARYAAATQAVQTARANTRAARDALTLNGQRFDTLPVCPLSLAEAEALREAITQVRAEQESTSRTLDALRAGLAERRARIAAIKSEEGLIGDAAARALREERDALWAAHRERLTEDSAESFAKAMARVDTAADLRLSHAAALGTLRQQEQDLAAETARAEVLTGQCAALDAAREAHEARLAEAARAAGLTAPLAPEVFVAWLRKLDTASEAAAEQHRCEDTHRDTFEKAQRLMSLLSEFTPREDADFEALVALAKAELETQQAQAQQWREAEARFAELSRDRARRAAKLEACEAETAAARADWSAQIAAALPEGIDAAVLDASLQPLHDLRAQDKDRASVARQILTMEEDQRQFATQVEALSKQVGASGTGTPLEVFDRMKTDAEQAAEDETRARDLRDRIKARQSARADAQKTLDDIALRVAEMAKAFPDDVETGTLDSLRQAVGTAREVIDDRSRRKERIRALKALLEVKDVAAARAALEGASQTGLQAQLDEARADLKEIELRYKGAIETRSTAEQALRGIGGEADVAQLVQRKATLELEMQDAALHHLELSLGHRLAETAIRRYRDSHRSTMMQATERAFTALTNGAYTRLQTQVDGAAETLLALDANGMAKQAQDMSKGTRFQLYLALRAAAYEQLADQGLALPFFCDDILETFDEDRTRSACHVLERVGRRGQAIYLTHHNHVVEIAREVCGDAVQVHRIAT